MFRRGATTTQDPMERTTPSAASIDGAGQSMLFTLLGAGGLIVSAFLEWIRPDAIQGANLSYRAFFDPAFGTDAPFFRSAGFMMVILGLVAILGLVGRAGWLTRLAGAGGIIGFALFAITLHRAGAELPRSLGIGTWVLLGGGLIAMFGGFFARRPRIIVTRTPTTA